MHFPGQSWTIPTHRVPSVALLAVLAVLLLAGCNSADESQRNQNDGQLTLLNVSYDPTRELYYDLNQAFSQHWEEATGQRVTVRMSHGGSGSQSKAVIEGLSADVVTLAMAHDIDAIADQAGLLPTDWQDRLPGKSAPYTSTLMFLVRKGNPKQIRDWEDLARPGVRVMTPNPKTSGVARWNYLALWGYALRRELGVDFADVVRDPAQTDRVAAARSAALAFVEAVYSNVPVLEDAARRATNNFVQNHIGDVLITWENEVLLGLRRADAGGLEIVVPSVTILTEPVAALVDVNVERRGTRMVAEGYLTFLYSEVGQDLVGRHFYRPAACAKAQAKYSDQFAPVEMFTIDDVFGGWAEAHRVHFADGGTFDDVDRARRARAASATAEGT